ncbi:MAG: pyruvate, phosphate dikinase, partial [Pseudomonadota bacterium]
AKEFDDPDFAKDTHQRFIASYADIVLKTALPKLDSGASVSDWRDACEKSAGASIPDAPEAQVLAAVHAVFNSWNSRRAKKYRKQQGIADDLGTAVTIQAMVFGNLDERSGTGVLFTRNPLTGDKQVFGEYLPRAQGEDVVSGEVTPEPLSTLASQAPEVHAQLIRCAHALEQQGKDVQDIEFTLQAGQLFLLQARTAKRSARAAVECAVQMVDEGLIDEPQALLRVSPKQIESVLVPRVTDAAFASAESLATGTAACAGVGIGRVVRNADEAEAAAKNGEKVVLACAATSPEDVHGMAAADAVITERGGTTSHAAVVGRALNVPTIVNCGENQVLPLVGQVVTVDANRGAVLAGRADVSAPSIEDDPSLQRLAGWAYERSPVRILKPSEAAEIACLNLDEQALDDDLGNVSALLAGHTAARGALLNSEQGASAAVAAGVETIICDEPLMAALTAIHRVNERDA